MDDEDMDLPESEPISYEWRSSHQMADALWLAASVARSTADFLEATAQRAASHHNFLVERDEFQQAAAQELETIIKTEE